MKEYEASCMRVEKISTAVQTIKENLTCRICLELFSEPVTIKCGHKFCRDCILRVTNNENSSCPFCNTKIQKRSIPREGNTVLQTIVRKFENLVKEIQTDSGIDVLQPCNKLKNTKESSLEYNKPSTSKVQDTPSTSKGSSSIIVSQKFSKPKVANSVRCRLSLTKKKTDVKSPSQSSEKNTLHKYLSNKSDPVPNEVVQSQEKVKSWLESCTSDDNDNIQDSIQVPSTKVKDSFTTDQITSPPDEIYSIVQENEMKESDVSPVPLSGGNSESKFKETQMRIQEAEMMAKKKKMSLSLNEKGNVKTPSSVPATSHSDASDWHRIKQVGRQMQVKTFKTLNVSIEKYSPSVGVSDAVIYNSTNNGSKNISHDSDANNSSADKTPLQTKKDHPLKYENNNLLKKSPQIITDEKICSMDSTSAGSHKHDVAFDLDVNQLKEIIGIAPTASVSKTSEKTKTSLNLVSESNLKSKSNQSSPSKSKLNSGQELSDDELSNCDSRKTVTNLRNSPSRKNRLSLKSLKGLTNSKNSCPSDTPDKINQKEKESSNNLSSEKFSSRLLLESVHGKTNSIPQKLASAKSPLSDNLANERSSSLSSGCRIIFKKLGKICKKKNNVPFLCLGKLEQKKCLFLNNNPHGKPSIVMKSIVPVCVDYKNLMEDKSIANLDEFSSDESHLKTISSKGNLQLTPECSPVKVYEEPMNIDEDVDVVHRPGQSNQEMEVDEAILPSVKMIVKRNSEDEMSVEKIKDFSPESPNIRKSLKNKDLEKIPPRIDENVPEPFRNTNEDNVSNNSEKENKNYDPFPESSSRVDTAKNLVNILPTKVSTAKKSSDKTDLDRDRIISDLISISSDDSDDTEVRNCGTNRIQDLRKAKYTKPCPKSKKKKRTKSVESCTEDEVSVTPGKRVGENLENAKHGYSSSSNSSLKSTIQKKRTHSESSTEDDVVDIIGKWMDSDKDHITKKVKISLDSEEMINRNASKVKRRSRLSSSSDEQEEKFEENKCLQNSLVDEMIPKVKSQSVEGNGNKLTTMPSSMLSADLFESNEKFIQPNIQCLQKQSSEIAAKITSAVDSDAQSDKENISERSRENVTVIDSRQLKRRKSIVSSNSNNDDRENKEYKRTADYKKSIKSTEEHADEIESSYNRRKSVVSRNSDDDGKKSNECKRTVDYNKSIKSTENHTDEIESSRKRRRSVTSKNSGNDGKENNECKRIVDCNKSFKSTEDHVDEIESSPKRRKSVTSKNSDNGDKENNEYKRTADYKKKTIQSTEDPADEIESLPEDKDEEVKHFETESDPYFVRESLLNVTQEQLACKNIEKDLFGVDLSRINENQNEGPLDIEKCSTPHRKPKNSEENDDFDSDNIEATPVAKRRHTFRLPSSPSSAKSEVNSPGMSSPGEQAVLIPAITPVKNTKSYPLCHSTPMISIDSLENQIHPQTYNIKIVCSGLTAENVKLVHKFVDRFNVKFQPNFDMDVTHVVLKVDPKTKAGVKTFKYIQGIAFKKHVISFEWITDCLAKNQLLDANDEKYDVLDPDILEPGCKKSRLSSSKLFKDFVFCCLEPFKKVALSEFEELLTYNGAVIVSSVAEFHVHKDKLKVIIVGSDDLDTDCLAYLNKVAAVAVYFEWVVDCLSQFQILSLFSYLCETTVDKARSLGFPPVLLVEEETLEGDDDEGYDDEN